VSFAALPESYANSKPGGPDKQFNKERRRKRKKSGSRTPSDVLDTDSDEGGGSGWWAGWLLSGNNAGGTGLRFDHEARVEERVARWGIRPSPM